MNIIIILLAIAVCYYFLIFRKGNFSFWKKASKHPDFVFDCLIKDKAWLIDNGHIKVSKEKYAGPFLLYVPSLNKTIKIYGEVGKYEKSQSKIEKKIDKLSLNS